MSKQNNPFEITFGKEPFTVISRENDVAVIKDSFSSENPNSQIYIITGPRGSGKTVAMSSVVSFYKTQKNWITVSLNAEREILEQLASKLYDAGKLRKLFLSTDFGFSFHGLTFSIKGSNPITNVSTLLVKEFEYLKKKNIRVLVSIDEISSNQNVKTFVTEYQILLSAGYPIFLLMTGLYQNISLLQKQKTLTFLYRAPKVVLSDLNHVAVANSYQKIFSPQPLEAVTMAAFVNGYAFAYQLLGDILYRSNKTFMDCDAVKEFDEIIFERAYLIIYNDLSEKEKAFLKYATEDSSNKYISLELNMKSNEFSNYKKSLINKGLVSDSDRDNIVFKLPRFKNFIEFIKHFE